MRGFTMAAAVGMALLASMVMAAPAMATNCQGGVCFQQVQQVHYVPVQQQVVVRQYAPLQVQQVQQYAVQRQVVQKVQHVQRARQVTQRRGLFGRRITRIVE